MNETATGRLVIISGPSGAGKSTIVRRLLSECPLPLELSVSATTRPSRPGEIDGRDYHFLDDQQFKTLREANAFLEYKEVFGRGIWYGTLAEQVRRGLDAGKWVILEIDVEGAASVLSRDVSPITIFLHPGGMEELERRLRERATENEAAIARRLDVARGEMEALPRYDHEIVNRRLDPTVEEICLLLQSYARTTSSIDRRPCIGCDS